MKKLNQIVSVMVFAVMATACGNMAQNPDPRFVSSGPYNGTSSPSSFSNSMQCSETINIKNSSGDLSKEYRACATSGSMGSIKVYPVSQASESVCVFPAVNGTPIFYNSRYVAQCGTLSQTGSTLNFQGVNFDSIYVVAQVNATTFSQCLYYGNPSACANQAGFSYASGRL
jgi:hypothetical protein